MIQLTSKYLCTTALLAATFFLSPALSFAVEVKGVSFKDEVLVGKKKLILNGVGLRTKTFFKVKVYLAGLYLEKPSTDYEAVLNSNEVKKIELVFLRDVDGKAIIESWKEGFGKNCKPHCKELAPKLEALDDLTRNVKNKQWVYFTFYPDHFVLGSQGRETSIEGGEFSRVVLATFIGQQPPTVSLREGLMGLKKLK